MRKPDHEPGLLSAAQANLNVGTQSACVERVRALPRSRSSAWWTQYIERETGQVEHRRHELRRISEAYFALLKAQACKPPEDGIAEEAIKLWLPPRHCLAGARAAPAGLPAVLRAPGGQTWITSIP